MLIHNALGHHLFVHNSCVLVILISHGNEGFFLHFSTSMLQSHIQLAN